MNSFRYIFTETIRKRDAENEAVGIIGECGYFFYSRLMVLYQNSRTTTDRANSYRNLL